jgi:hypothetical protein
VVKIEEDPRWAQEESDRWEKATMGQQLKAK